MDRQFREKTDSLDTCMWTAVREGMDCLGIWTDSLEKGWFRDVDRQFRERMDYLDMWVDSLEMGQHTVRAVDGQFRDGMGCLELWVDSLEMGWTV